MIQFPFAAIVGMEDAKSSLIYHSIDPRIGGTLFLGHRGCAKSTLVRAFAEVLRLACDHDVPFVEVPLGATEDRLLGSVDAQSLVENRLWTDRIGLIEEANGGVLYIDEVNLLPDHLADFILDSASSDQYRMERDGIRRVVEGRYILVGTMNPEEGDLRPQLSDRFAHGVPIREELHHLSGQVDFICCCWREAKSDGDVAMQPLERLSMNCVNSGRQAEKASLSKRLPLCIAGIWCRERRRTIES